MRKGWIGPLVQAKDGKKPWVCDYTHPLTGKKKREKIAVAGANKKEREKAYHEFMRKLESGERVGKSNLTFGDALDAYEKWCEQRCSVNDRMTVGTLTRTRHSINKHLRPDLGKEPLGKIDAPMVEDYIYKKAKKYRAMQFELYHTIKCTLDRAVWLDMISISPLNVKKLRLPPRPKSTRSIPTIEEGRALWHAIEREGREYARIPTHTHMNRMATTALAMFGGMCAGEMAGLQWEHVDFIDGYIYVEHSLCRHGGLKGPKNLDRHRFIIMSQEMNQWLTEIAQRDHHPQTGFVFKPDPKMRNRNWRDAGGNHLLRSMTQGLKDAQVRLGFVNDDGRARWTMHELRHYAGSVWLELGYRLEDVSRMLGHGKMETTKKYYIHYFKKQNLERDRQLMIKVSELHRLPSGAVPALPKPMRDSCEIEGQVIELKE